MKILFLGDSITEGACASCYEKSYVPLVGEILKAEVVNYGVSGSRIARQYIRHYPLCLHNFDMISRLDIMEKQADVVVLLGGTNDFGHGTAPIGNKTDTDVFTFYGAVNTLLNKLIETYSKEKIMIVLPLPRTNENNEDGDGPEFKHGIKATLSIYKNIIKEVAERNGLLVRDYDQYFRKDGKPNSDLQYDGLHPNDIGHKLLADLILNDIKKHF